MQALYCMPCGSVCGEGVAGRVPATFSVMSVLGQDCVNKRTYVRMMVYDVFMVLGDVLELVGGVHGFDPAASSLDECKTALGSVTRLSGWLESRRLAIVSRIGELSPVPEDHVGRASRTTQRNARKVTRRAVTASKVSALAESLADGKIAAEHVDVATRALGQVEPEHSDRLAVELAKLVPVAELGTPEEFEHAVRAVVDRLNLVDGEARLVRQRRAARLFTWVNKATGMFHVSGEFDPQSGLRVHARLQRRLAATFADTVPEGCPTDPFAKQDWLRAQAFLAIFFGETVGGSTAAETIVVVDTRDGTIRWDLDIDLPGSAVQAFIDQSKIFFVDVHGCRINFADGCLNLGRSRRLANRAQRRAKRAIHATCAVPGCAVKFEFTKLHHIIWWENGGLTDLENLIPICVRHHALIHQGHLVLTVGPNGNITFTTNPAEDTMDTGPPQQGVA